MTGKEAHMFDPGELAALGIASDIDRRQCSRTVPMRVICPGASRTGTTSLRQALIELGFGDCYHMSSALQENPSDVNMWIEAVEGKIGLNGQKPFTRDDWDQLLGHCQSITDTPCNMFWEELLQTYPDAKVVLTIRDSPAQWFESQMKTIMQYAAEVVMPVEDGTDPKIKLFQMLVEHYDSLRVLWDDYQNGTENAKKWYEEHIRAVSRRVPANNLLIFNVKEGWQPLCEFLDVPTPNRAFPRRNDRATFRKNMDDFKAFVMAQPTEA